MQEQDIARALLAIDAVEFRPNDPVTFASGILSPVYVDNRRLIFHPEAWATVIAGFRAHIDRESLRFDVVAGIETAGIPHSSVLAYVTGKPSVFVRKQPKAHGMKSAIEGGDVAGKHVLLIEDMITTGGSSLKGVESLRAAGASVTDCLAITTFDFPMSRQAYKAIDMRLGALVRFSIIVEEAMAAGRFGTAERDLILDWLADPHGWATKQGL
jgi:orotate phosphoribosyltransferase